MKDHTYFLVLYFSIGCSVLDGQQTKYITGFTGGSVVLPCSCAQPQSTVTTFTWKFQDNDQWIEVFKNEKFSGRRVLFNESSPTNTYLLISGLSKEDSGYYQCETEQHSTAYVLLTVKGCDLANAGQTFDVTGYSGQSVVLPCFCTELQAKPEQIQWKYFIENNYKEIYPKEENRVKLLNQSSPGNLSLHISDLNTNDQGDYYCWVTPQQVIYFRLYVKEKPHANIGSSTDGPSTQDPQQQDNTHQYGFILVTVFSFTLLLTFLAVSTGYAKDEMPCS